MTAATVAPVATPFGAILRRAVEATPFAIGGAFADPEGEMVDSYSTMSAHEWAVLTAYYGVVLGQVSSAFGTLHFGGAEYFIAQHESIEIIVHTVEGGYFALIACTQSSPLPEALEQLRLAAVALRQEMQ